MSFNANNSKAIALKSFKVGAKVENVKVESNAPLGKLQGGLFINSDFLVGVANLGIGELPTSTDQFDVMFTIASIKVKGIKGEPIWLSNSRFAAWNIGKVALGFADTNNNGQAFGIAAHIIKSYVYKDATTKIKASKPEAFDVLQDIDDLATRLV